MAMGVLLQRFEDPEVEREFARAERAARGPAVRALIVVGVASLLSYSVLNPLYFPPEGVVAYAIAATGLIAGLLAFFFLSRTEYYLENRWIDVPMCVLLAAAMKGLTLALAGQAAITGFPPHTMALVQ